MGEEDPAEGRLLVADSWLVEEGAVRGADRHLERFAGACGRSAGIGRDTVAEFWAQALAAVPAAGAWFPRVELRRAREVSLHLLLRPAPERGDRVSVLPWPGPDPRSHPRVKGPDLDRLAGLRQQARRGGADDALLLTSSGLVTESTTSALLWWEDRSLCLPSPALRAMPSVTSALITDLARREGVRVRRRRARLEDLSGREVWLVNALHGIRVVCSWTGSSLVAGPGERAGAWRARLEDLRRPLPSRPPSGGGP